MLVTIDKIRKSLNINGTDTSKDNLLKTYESIAKNWIESFCNQPIESVEITKIFKTSGDVYYLNYTNVQTLEHLYSRENEFGSWEEILTGDFVLGTDSTYYLKAKYGFSNIWYKAIIKVGYSTIPEVIQNVCLERINVLYNQYENGNVDEMTKTTTMQSGQSITINKIDLDAKHKQQLLPFKRISL